ncbi:MAG: DUF481 domain-containing protein [Bacteroidetes bacterium]|nr:DUF481 domain-containing protein [Bacteroidota bacterium]
MYMRIFCLAFCLVLLSTPPAGAQIVNIERARMQSDTTGWMGGAGMAYTLIQNTQKISITDLEAHLQYKTSNDKGLWLILGNYSFLKAGKNKLVSNGFFHVRYNYKVNDWLRWEVFGQYQNNSITQIDSRVLAGTGPRFKLVKNKFLRLYAATLIMFESEKERTNPVVSHKDIRSSSYLSFTWTPRDNLELISTTFIQPLLKKWSDYRLLNQASLRVKATKHFSLSVKWNYLHDRFPAGTAPRTTYTFATGVDYDF